MIQYTVTILDTDTMIERQVDLTDVSAQAAHKTAMFTEVASFDIECVARIKEKFSGQVVYDQEKGFIEPHNHSTI